MGVASQFSEPERGYIAEAVDSRRALFEIWARKEAYIKGMGRGLSHPLGDFDVTPIGEMLVRDWSADSPPESWAVQSVKLPVSGYAAAIGMVYPLPPIEVIEVTVDVLLSYFFQSTR
jgi:4'-phosphopantetheinyl transferase